VNTIENRLREAYQAAAETVRPESVPAPPEADLAGPARPAGTARAPRPARAAGPIRLAIPLTAAAAAAAIAVAATIVVPRVWPGRQAAPGGWNAPPPRYYAAVVYQPHSDATIVNIVNAATGRITGRLSAPRHGIYFQDVASLGTDRTFVATAAVPVGPAIQHNCHTWLYRFRITRRGQPAGLRPLSVPEVAGYPVYQSLAGSADGTTVAYATDLQSCTPSKPPRYAGRLTALRLASGQSRTWRYRLPAEPITVSLSANGRLLGFVSNRSDGARGGGPAANRTWVLATSSPAGPLQRYYHPVTGPHQFPNVTSWPSAEILSPSGRTMLTTIDNPGGNTGLMAVRDYQTRTGRLLRTVRLLHRHGVYYANPGLTSSISGRYVLLYIWNAQEARLDLATGRLVVLPRPKSGLPVAAAW
jgi:hypothetical protein